MRTKRCYKYKTVRVTLRLSNAYEKIYKEGGVNVSITRKNRTFFLRMFDSKMSYAQIKDKFRWQACKELGGDIQQDDVSVIKEYVKIYRGFFGKVIRVSGLRFLILYFRNESDLRVAISSSIEIHDIGCGLWIKKPDDYIDDSGKLQERVTRNDFQNKASISSDSSRRQQQSSKHVNFLKSHQQWR
ncbi:hypothetical protein RhiirA1_171065 [Rhizophagus irregularis]|uniref:Uncharacterized protein n=1 Tax=Rhizophagus irregularis TaxID=588596 RepID=A0A2N0QR27_9GLOM|nr:hypothetical protein RhiirA1_171065 [Rhizophagus irregularis]